MYIGKFKCINTKGKSFLNSGDIYRVSNYTEKSLEVLGNDWEYHTVELECFEVVELSPYVKTLINVIGKLGNWQELLNLNDNL